MMEIIVRALFYFVDGHFLMFSCGSKREETIKTGESSHAFLIKELTPLGGLHSHNIIISQ
jgi:hypothetical protein